MTAASGADQPTLADWEIEWAKQQTLRDQLTSIHGHAPGQPCNPRCTTPGRAKLRNELDRLLFRSGADNYDAALDMLARFIEADRERAKAEGGAEALEQAADALDTRAVQLWSAYKSGPITDPRRANPHTEGESDGWENAGTHVRARAAALRGSTGGGT